MRRLLGWFFGLAGAGYCLWWKYHRPERARIGGSEVSLGGFRCTVCGLPGLTLDDFVADGDAGYVMLDRPTFNRLRREVERDSYGGRYGKGRA